jgi:hypothetical protein
MCVRCERVRRGSEAATLTRIIHECRREASETEAHRSFSHVDRRRRADLPSRRPNEKSHAGREDRTTKQGIPGSSG